MRCSGIFSVVIIRERLFHQIAEDVSDHDMRLLNQLRNGGGDADRDLRGIR